MSYKEAFFKANIQGIIALILIVGGLYILAFNDSGADIKICVATLMGSVVSHYFNNNPKHKSETLKDKE